MQSHLQDAAFKESKLEVVRLLLDNCFDISHKYNNYTSDPFSKPVFVSLIAPPMIMTPPLAKKRKASNSSPTSQDIDAANATTRLMLGKPQPSWLSSTHFSSPHVSHAPAMPEATVTHIAQVARLTPPLGQDRVTSQRAARQANQISKSPRDRPTTTSSASTPALPAYQSAPLQDANLRDGDPQLGLTRVRPLPLPAPSEGGAAGSSGHAADPSRHYMSTGPNRDLATPAKQHGPMLPLPSLESYALNNVSRPPTSIPRPCPDVHTPASRSPPVFFATAYLPTLEAFRAAHPGLSPQDHHRLDLVAHASRTTDPFFIILSQFVSSHCLGQTRQIPKTNPLIDPAGLQIVEQIIGPTARLSSIVVLFLQRFPLPLDALRVCVGELSYRQLCDDIANCVADLQVCWGPWQHKWLELKVLPLSRDLVTKFRMKSALLGRLAFLTTLRHIWGTDTGQFAEQAFNTFVAEQRQFMSTNTVTNEQWHYNLYKQLYSQHLSLQNAASEIEAPNHTTQARGPLQSSSPRNASLMSQTRPANRPLSTALMLQPGRRYILSTPTSGAAEYQARAQQTSRPANRPPKGLGLLIPPADAKVFQQSQPDFIRLALHQAHLRDASLVHHNAHSEVAEGFKSVYYRYTSGFALSPRHLTTKPVQEHQFDLCADHLARLPEYLDGTAGAPPTGFFDQSSLMFRLRCWEKPNNSTSPWDVGKSMWPSWLYFSLNGEPLEVRRKLQHGKCLPIDVTRHVQASNTLKVYANLSSKATLSCEYAIGVEKIVFATKETLRNDCLGRIRSARTVRADLIASLSASQGEGSDDELSVTQARMTIPLFEPFSNAKLVDTPVRGARCKHARAFDLDVFLETRGFEGEETRVSKVDDWKCPVCGADARPHMLMVDGFLSDVRKTLAESGKLRTRSLVFESDGNYKFASESEDSEGEDDTQAEGGRTGRQDRSDVVEIDSD